MGMPTILTQAGSGTCTPWWTDWRQDPFNIGFGVVVTGGTATYSVEHTFDNLDVVAVATATWMPNSGVTAATTSTTNGNYAYPVMAIRLNVSTTSTATTVVKGTFIQATLA